MLWVIEQLGQGCGHAQARLMLLIPLSVVIVTPTPRMAIHEVICIGAGAAAAAPNGRLIIPRLRARPQVLPQGGGRQGGRWAGAGRWE